MFKFLDVYKIGVGFIDEEHLEIIKLANKLYISIMKYKDLELANELFQSFAIKTTLHFDNEESYMEEIDYFLLTEHSIDHESIVNKLLGVLSKLENSKYDIIDVYAEMLKEVNDSILTHMAEEDIKIKYFLEY